MRVGEREGQRGSTEVITQENAIRKPVTSYANDPSHANEGTNNFLDKNNNNNNKKPKQQPRQTSVLGKMLDTSFCVFNFKPQS